MVTKASTAPRRFRSTIPPVADKPEGPISAAIIAAGIGAFALGLFTTLAEASATLKDWLQWNDRVGPLSGKTLLAVAVWLAAWAILHVTLPTDRSRPAGPSSSPSYFSRSA